MLIRSPVHVARHTVDLDVGLINEPPVTQRVTTWPRRVDQSRCETLHPPVNGDVVNVDAAFGDEFLDVAVRQPEAQLPAHGHQDHLGPKPVPGKRIGLNNAGTIHPVMLAAGHPIRQRNGASSTDCRLWR